MNNSLQTVTGSAFIANCEFKDQYGDPITNGKASDATYKIVCIDSAESDGYSIAHNESSQAEIVLKKAGTYKFKITVTTADGSSKSYTYLVKK